ncbi:MAG: hypothetical protein ACFCU5_00310 [Pleurocapsa sp.]
MTNLQQIKVVAAEVHLNLDNPESVKKQLNRLNQAQKKLQQMKQEVVGQIQDIHRQANSFGLDEAASIGLHLLGKHRIARQVSREGNRIERRRKQQANPYLKMRDLIDNYLFECDRLKLMANNYLQERAKT